MAHGWVCIFFIWSKKKKKKGYLSVWRQAVCAVFDFFQISEFRLKPPQNRMRCVNRVGCSWPRPSESYRIIPFGNHLSSGFYQCPSSSLSFRSSFVCCSSTSGPSDSNPEPSSNRSYSRRWHNPLPRRRHPDQMPSSSRIARDWIDSDTTPVSQGIYDNDLMEIMLLLMNLWTS